MALKVVTAKRAALYARFSTDLQSDRSVDDQLALARAYAQGRGYRVVETYFDRAKSGASLFGRDGIARLVDLVDAGGCDVVVAEHSDRLSRDMADLAGLHKRFTFRAVEIDCVNGGQLDTITVGLHGLVGQMQREEGARKVRRGMQGVARDGRHAGGRAYGYRPIAGRPGELEIEPEEAAVVFRIFETYVAGDTPRAIAAKLNAERVAPPRGASWNSSTINGNLTRGHGILLNEIYAGRLIWNRVRMVKDPSTGRRVSRPNPKDQWISTDAPHLAIVPRETFDAAQARKASRAHVAPRQRQKPKRLLSGLLTCGACGAGMHADGADRKGQRILCARVKESRSCSHTRKYYLADVERLVVTGLRDEIEDPVALTEYVRAYHEERRALAKRSAKDRSPIERKLAEVERGLTRLIDMIVAGSIDGAVVKERSAELTLERDKLRSELATCDQEAGDELTLHPAALLAYREDIEALANNLGEAFAETGDRAITAFRDLVERVTIEPSRGGEKIVVHVQGRLSALLERDFYPTMRVSGGSVVAEEGLEPPTRGL